MHLHLNINHPVHIHIAKVIMTNPDETPDETKESLNTIINKLNQIMATEQQWQAALARIDAATTAAGTAASAIQARIDALNETIKGLGLPSATEDALLAQTEGLGGNAEALASALTAMGKTPETPVPVEPPAPVEPVVPE